MGTTKSFRMVKAKGDRDRALNEFHTYLRLLPISPEFKKEIKNKVNQLVEAQINMVYAIDAEYKTGGES